MRFLKRNPIGVAAVALFVIVVALVADTLNVTWAGTEWNTTWADVAVLGGCDTTTEFAYTTGDGNPQPSRRATCQGKNDTATRVSRWAGTWEDLGVQVSNTVSTIQVTDADVQAVTDTNCDTQTMGPFELRNSSGGLEAEMWAGRTVTVADASPVSIGSQSAVSVGTLTASDASIRLDINSFQDIANSSGAICQYYIDNLDIAIVHTAPAGATDKTWADAEWNTDWTGGAADTGGCTGGDYANIYGSTGGNPTHRWQILCLAASNTGSAHFTFAGTWEDLGVTAGNVVSTVRMLAYDTLAFDGDCDTQTVGPLELRNSSDGLEATLWSGRTTTTGDSGMWVTEPTQSAVSVGTLTASDAAIRLWSKFSWVTPASAPNCSSSYDNLTIRIISAAAGGTTINRMLIAWYETTVGFKNGKQTSVTRRIK